MTDDWDPSVPRHKELAHQIELGNGIPEMRHISVARQALKNVGFEIEHEEDLADRPDEIPWYYPLEGDVRKAQTVWDYFTVWRMSKMGQFFTHNGVWAMEKLGLIPKGTWSVGESLRVAGEALVAGGQSKVSCPIFYHSFIPCLSRLSSSSRQCTLSSAASPKTRRFRRLRHSLFPALSYYPNL